MQRQSEQSKATMVQSTQAKTEIASGGFQFEDNRPETAQLQQLQGIANQFTAQSQLPIQPKKNKTGLPDNLKSGIENLSGMSIDDVKVHRNSDKPAQLNAHAYAQGTDIHLASGQEKHLPHEAWHVVQQKQGRVKPTLQMKGKVNVNDDEVLEKEADVMGAKAVQVMADKSEVIVQRKQHGKANHNLEAKWDSQLNVTRKDVVQRLEEEDIESKVDKKKLKALRKKYSNSLGLSSKLYHFAPETFDYYFDQASSLVDLGNKIEAAIATAEKSASEAAEPQAEQLPSAAPSMVAPSTPSTGFIDLSAKQKNKKKNKKKKQGKKNGMSLDEYEKQNPQPAAEAAPMDFAAALQAPAPPQAAPKALAPIEINDVGATNELVIQLIGSMVGHKVDSVTHTFTNPQTVYYDVVILGPVTINPYMVNSQQNRYTLKLHYHPAPNTNNWLHLKRSDGASPDNVIATNNAILAGHNAELKEGQTDWETTQNGGAAAPQGI